MRKSREKSKSGNPVVRVLIGLFCLGLVIAILLRGTDVALLHPKGFIAGEQLKLMLSSAALLLEIGIPTVLLLYFTAWKYRESNKLATYNPDPPHNKLLVFSIWAVPTTFMVLLALIMWPATHDLAPQKLIANGVKPLEIQVIAMRWKWLFIYPEQGIATVNFIQVPVGTPLQFELTADETPMSSFWIPHLGGQLYAMTGHINQLNLLADKAGDYPGSAAEINGSGFAGMKFTARASTIEDFDNWVQDVKLSTAVLDTASYKKLLNPSEYNRTVFYAKTDPKLYANMLMKYAGSHGQQHAQENMEHK